VNTLPLSPVDYIFTGTGSQPITFAFSYQKSLDPELLQNSLRELLKVFPAANSRLHRVSETDLAFSAMEDGLTVEVAELDTAFERSRGIEQYIAPVRSFEGEPLTRICLTQTPAGSVLAVSMSHALVDGFSYFHFLSSWARTCRGERILNPHLDRTMLSSVFAYRPREITEKDIYADCGLFLAGRRSAAPAGAMKEERLFIPDGTIRTEMQAVKEKRNTSVTENDIICATLWRKFIPIWTSEKGSGDTYLTSPFDFRRALPGFPKTYFGCALSFATASIRLEELEATPVGDLAVLAKSAVGRMKSEYIANSMNALENIRRQKGLAAMEEIHLRHPQRGIIVTNLTRMPIQDIDFGFGPPADFAAFVDVLRSAAVLPASNGVEVIIAHPSDAG